MTRSLVPASFFGMPLGLLGLGLAWREAVELWALPPFVAEAVLGTGALLWAVLVAVYAAKWIWARAEAATELEHPIQCCFLGLAPVTTSLVALAAMPYSRAAALMLFAAGAAGALAFALFRTGRLWMGGREVGTTTPVLYLPAVAGGFVTATAASLLGLREWGRLAFGAGIFSWLAIESVLLHRLYTEPPLAPALRPLLGIQLAPAAVGGLAYLSVVDGHDDPAAQSLVGYALLQLLLLGRLARWIAEQPFVPAYWAFSFGSAALAGACIRLAAGGAMVERALAPPLFLGVNVLIGWLIVRTLMLLANGRLLGSPSVATVPKPAR